MCLCDETSGWRGHGTEGDQSATNHCLWVQRTVYAIKKGSCRKECKGPTKWKARGETERKRHNTQQQQQQHHHRRPYPSVAENLASGPPVNCYRRAQLPYMSLHSIMSSLPQKPTENILRSPSGAGPSKICAICSSPAKYTCPRCSARSCSLDCSQTHKSRDSCSGIRDPVKFVPLNQYSQGVWSSDYTLLEEGRRQVAGWGKGIKIEEVNGGVIGGRGRGRGSRAPKGQRRSKTDGLRRELEKYGCMAEFMPEGMARKKTNQSSWNPKSVPFDYCTLYHH